MKVEINTAESRPHRFRLRLIALSVAAAVSATAHAQETVLPTVTVSGQAASLENALDVQQAADNVVSAVKADDIGQLPDANAAEALQRVPGITVERDQGEGRYVRVRGLGPDLNSVSINGSLVPAPESDRRAVALDVLSSVLVGSLEVSKTLTPDQSADALGGHVEVKTLSAFDHPGRFATLEAGMSRDELTDQNAPSLAGAWSDRFLDGKLGVAVGLSHEQRKFGSDNVESGGAWDEEDGEYRLKKFEQRDYLITRERSGAVFNLDYRPKNDERYYLNTLYSRFSDEEVRQAHKLKFEDAQLPGVIGEAESERALKARKETQVITSVVLGTEQHFGDWKMAAAVGSSRASEDTPPYIAGATFAGRDSFNAGYTNTRRPMLLGDAALNSADAYELDEIEREATRTTDREHNLRLDLSRRLSLLGAPAELKFGGKLSRRKKDNHQTTWVYDSDAIGAVGSTDMSDYLGRSVDYGYGDFGPTLSSSALKAVMGKLDADDYLDEEESRINDFRMQEDIDAAYVQSTVDLGPWRVLAGVRYEGTRFKAEGTSLVDGDFVDTKASNSYRDWLPGLHLRRDLDADTTLRGAWSQSVVRPTFGQLAPGYVIDGDEASFGNPDLDAMKSNNLDLGIEHRMGFASAVSAYVFHKRIDNFIYQTDLAGSGDWASFSEAVTYANGGKARVSGLELAASHQFSWLPSPWNGLLVAANATFTDSSATIGRYDDGNFVSRDIPLPSQSDRSFNLMLGYEQGPVNLRLAATHKSAYLLEVSDAADPNGDLYVDAQTHWDFTARYNVSKNVQLFFEALNLSDENYYVYAGNRDLNAQYEGYGRTYKLGLKATLF